MEQLRIRVKAIQETSEALKARNVQLLVEKEELRRRGGVVRQGAFWFIMTLQLSTPIIVNSFTFTNSWSLSRLNIVVFVNFMFLFCFVSYFLQPVNVV